MQLVMKDGKVFKSEIKELANCARAERRFLVPAQRSDFFIHSVLDFGCAVGIMRQSRSLVGTGVGSLGVSRREPKGGVMSVLELCDREIAVVPLEATVADAMHKMLDHHVGAVAVVDSEYRVAGIFTERDVLRKMALSRLDPHTTPVRDLMTTPVEMATRATGPGEALTIMLERHFRHLPVVDDNGKLLGILSIRNLLEWRVEDLGRQLDSLEQYVSNDGPGG
jgi:CBS domain-containing protein